jgi:branched-chain amino acid transport system substrate-binding protein
VNLWGSEVNWRTALAYDAAQALIAAIRQDASRTGIQQALATPSFAAQGATGSINFSPVGDREEIVQLVTIAPVTPQKNIYTFKPLN